MIDIYEGSFRNAETRGPSEEIERIEYTNGIEVYLKGHPYPMKGTTTIEAIAAVNVAKKLLPLLWIPYVRNISRLALKPYILREELLCPIAKEVQRIIPTQTGTIIAHVLQYDAAYRYRLQDLLTATNKESLSHKPIREIYRLLKINKKRDIPGVHKKIKRFATIICIALLWPPIRRQYREVLKESNFTALQLDESDKYWLQIRYDYKYGQK